MKSQTLIVPLLLFVVVDCRRESRKDRSRHNGRRAVRDEANDEGQGTCELEISCKGDTMQTAPVRLPIKGPRGPAGKPGMKGDQGEPGTPGEAGLPGKSAPAVPKVAFFVGLGKNVGPVKENTDLIFDKVITNIGGGYDVETGRFTAPFTGVYHFTVVVAAQGMQKELKNCITQVRLRYHHPTYSSFTPNSIWSKAGAAVMLIKENEMVETIWAESIPYWATSSNTAILDLASGQQVWLVLLSRAPYMHGYMYSSFSGYSLFKTDEQETDLEENLE